MASGEYEARWYAVYVRSRYEKKVHSALLKREIDTYLPLVNTIRQWADRKKVVYLPLFSGYVFVKIDLRQSQKILSVDGVVRIIGFGGKYIPIPDGQIQSVQRILNEDYEIEDIPNLKEGELVEIIAGPLRGLRGILLRHRSSLRFVVSIDIIGRSVAIEIKPHLLRTV